MQLINSWHLPWGSRPWEGRRSRTRCASPRWQAPWSSSCTWPCLGSSRGSWDSRWWPGARGEDISCCKKYLERPLVHQQGWPFRSCSSRLQSHSSGGKSSWGPRRLPPEENQWKLRIHFLGFVILTATAARRMGSFIRRILRRVCKRSRQEAF